MKVIVTVKVKLSMSLEDSLQFHNQLFSKEHIEYFRSIGNMAHNANLNSEKDGYLMAVDTWEVDDINLVKAFYTSENFKENMAGKFSSETPEVNYWIQDAKWVRFE